MSDAAQAEASEVGEAEPSAGEEGAQQQQQDESNGNAPAKEQEEQSNGGGAKASAGGGFDDATKRTVQKIPLLRTRAGPRDGDAWNQRLREELQALIQYVKTNKESDNDWFRIESNKTGTRWTGKCWSFYKGIRYEFELHFEIPVTYPVTNPDLCLPELEGKTAKMYRGGKICLTEHFQPLWQRNVPRFGIAHALALGLGPWLAAEVPSLVDGGYIEAS